MELSQEVISILVIAIICVIVSVSCVCIWFCRCRQDRIRSAEEKEERSVQLQQFEKRQAKNNEVEASIRVDRNPKLDTLDIERLTTTGSFVSHRGDTPFPPKSHSPTPVQSDHSLQQSKSQPHKEVIAQIEERIATASAIQRVKDMEGGNSSKNKRLDTISELGKSTDSLQRNDSKSNVFNVHREKALIEVDLNPGLNSSINLEKI